MFGMAKALCMTGLVVSGLVAILFAADLVAGFPFQQANMVMDISMLVGSILLGLVSWLTLREQA
jgi:hypothetical protein